MNLVIFGGKPLLQKILEFFFGKGEQPKQLSAYQIYAGFPRDMIEFMTGEVHPEEAEKRRRAGLIVGETIAYFVAAHTSCIRAMENTYIATTDVRAATKAFDDAWDQVWQIGKRKFGRPHCASAFMDMNLPKPKSYYASEAGHPMYL